MNISVQFDNSYNKEKTVWTAENKGVFTTFLHWEEHYCLFPSPRWGRQPSSGATTYDFAKFPQKLHEIERIRTTRGDTRP